MELPNCNGENFTHILLLFLMVFVMCFAVQIFLNQLSEKNPEEFKVVILDNGAFHKGKALIVPKNIFLLFLPPYSPELNPAELVWLNMKRKTTNVIYKTMDEHKEEINKIVKNMMNEEYIKKLCAFSYFFN